MLIGLPDQAKGRKLSKIVINRRLPNILFLSNGDILQFFFTNWINSKLISEHVSNDKTVFLCINATQVCRILISITIFLAHAQLKKISE